MGLPWYHDPDRRRGRTLPAEVLYPKNVVAVKGRFDLR